MRESAILMNVIENELGVNILSKNRKREVVDGRLICARILRDRGYSLKSIASVMGKDHSTVIHYLGLVNDLNDVDNLFSRKHLSCLRSFQELSEDQPSNSLSEMTDTQLKNELIALRSNLNSLLLENQDLKTELNKLKQEGKDYGDIITLIKSVVGDVNKELIIKKIRHVLNGI